MTTNQLDGGVLLRNLDVSHPDRYLFVGKLAGGVRFCYVHIRDGDSPIYIAVGRTTLIEEWKLQDQKRFAPVAKPYVIRRDDGHEVTYG